MGPRTDTQIEKKGHDWQKEEPVKKPFPEVKEPPPPPPPSDKPWVNYSQPKPSGGMQTQANKRKLEESGKPPQKRQPETVTLPPKPKKPKEEEELDLTPFINAHLEQFCTDMKEEEKKRAEESLKPLMKTNFCVLCNARTSGPAMATAHYNGKNHMKKVKTFLRSGGEFVPKKPEVKPEIDPKDMTADEKKAYEEKQKMLDKKVAEVWPSLLLSPCSPVCECIRYQMKLFMYNKWKTKNEILNREELIHVRPWKHSSLFLDLKNFITKMLQLLFYCTENHFCIQFFPVINLVQFLHLGLNFTLKALIAVAADVILKNKNYFSEKIRLGISCESFAWQKIDMNCQALFFLKNKNIKMSSAVVVISTSRVKLYQQK